MFERKNIKQTLMDRDGLSEEEAEKQVEELQSELMEHIENGDFASAEEVCYSVGLEPDYLEDLI